MADDTDWGALYLSHVEALAALGSGLSAEQLTASVPGTPAWTTHDVYAHLAGGPADQLSGICVFGPREDDQPVPA